MFTLKLVNINIEGDELIHIKEKLLSLKIPKNNCKNLYFDWKHCIL